MTVNLKNFFIRVPCPIPDSIVQATERLFTPQAAIAFLHTTERQLVWQVRADATRILNGLPVIDSRGRRLPDDHPRRQYAMKIQKLSETTVANITRMFESKIAEISAMEMPQGCPTQEESSISDWLATRFIKAWRMVAANPKVCQLLSRIGVSVSAFCTKEEVPLLLDTINMACEQGGAIVTEVKFWVRYHFFSVLAEDMPEDLLRGIQALPKMPAAADALALAEITIPLPITRQNVARFLQDIDTRVEIDDEVTTAIKRTVQAYLDATLAQSLCRPPRSSWFNGR